jgi:hypothetical protein
MSKEKRTFLLPYGEAFKVVKKNSIGLYLCFTATFICFPGIFFSTAPLSIMSIKDYILILNIIIAILDFISRPWGSTKIGRPLAYASVALIIPSSVFLIWQYLTDQHLYNEGTVYVTILLSALYMTNSGAGTSYHMSKASQLSAGHSARIKDAIGSLMVLSLLLGIGSGNVISTQLPTIKKALGWNMKVLE